jgi:hypothetical protein
MRRIGPHLGSEANSLLQEMQQSRNEANGLFLAIDEYTS